MKKAEMVVGELYALETPGKSRTRPITLISKMVMTSGRVRVRIEDPRHGPREIEVPSRWVKGIGADRSVAGLELVKSPHFQGPVAWLPNGGEVVERYDVPGFWLARRVHVAEDRALLDGVLVGVRRRELVPLGLVHKADTAPHPATGAEEPFLRHYGLSLGIAARRHVRVVDQRSPAFEELPTPREVGRRLTLGPRARTQYRWISSKEARGREQFELCREVERCGRIRWLDEDDNSFLDGEYVRYVVPKRFAVVLFDDPSGDDRQIRVDRIYPVATYQRGNRSIGAGRGR